jgi:hypothetical protein
MRSIRLIFDGDVVVLKDLVLADLGGVRRFIGVGRTLEA